jgi:hypothetical protein
MDFHKTEGHTSREMPTAITDPKHEFVSYLIAAYDEVVAAICDSLSAGNKPTRVSPFPELSQRDNGMPSISDGVWSGRGPIKYSSVLDAPYGDEEARARGRFPADAFPKLHSLYAYVSANMAELPGYAGLSPKLLNSFIEYEIAQATDEHFLRFGEVRSTQHSRKVILGPLARGLLDQRLNLAVIVPIALTRFNFDRVRLGKGTFLIRMSPALQRARWQAKAYGAKGHDSVLASATHAFVLTGWEAPNANTVVLSQALSKFDHAARERIDLLFAALRIETGIDTGYAQELRLARGWCHQHNHCLPSVYATGARRYPEAFDDFGWNWDPLPLVTKAQMLRVREQYLALIKHESDRLSLALRRLNAAMIRPDAADAILDATIGLEILLGDGDGQAIGWKLRMRAAALVGVEEGRTAAKAMSDAIKDVYEARSAIVHGARRSKGSVEDRAERALKAQNLALTSLRKLMGILLRHPKFLDPLRIDNDLLINPPSAKRNLK